jgi:hypothetical protein
MERLQSHILPNFEGENLTFTDESGKVLVLDYAPSGYSVRNKVIASTIADFQLSEDKSILTFLNPLVVTNSLVNGICSVIGGNSRLGLLHRVFEINKDKPGSFSVNPITIEYLSEDEVADKARLLTLAIVDNSSRPMTQSDRLVAVVNLFDGYMIKGLSDKDAKSAISEQLNLSPVQVQGYIDSAISVETYPFLFNAMDKGVLDIGTLKYIVSKFDALCDVEPDTEYNLREIFTQIEAMTRIDAGASVDDINKKLSDIKIKKQTVNEVFESYEPEKDDEQVKPISSNEDEAREQLKRDKAVRKIEEKRIGSLSAPQCIVELTESRTRLNQCFGGLNGFVSTDYEAFLNILAQVEYYPLSGLRNILKIASGVEAKMKSLSIQTEDLIEKSTLSLQSVRTKDDMKALKEEKQQLDEELVLESVE